MTIQELDDVLGQLRVALEGDNITTALLILVTLKSPDQAEVFTELDDADKAVLLPQLETDLSADLLQELEDEEAAELVAALPIRTAIRIIEEMDPDEAADLLGDIEPGQAETILAGLENPEEVRPLLLHPDDSAGGLMTSEFLALRRRMTAADSIRAIREWHPASEDLHYLFVVDGECRLVGVISLAQLLLAESLSQLIEFMDHEVISIPAGADQEDVARLMQRYNLLVLPVVDAWNELLGVITIDDVLDVIEDEATEDIQRFGGALPLEKSYLNTGVATIARKRFGWLLLLFFTATLTGTVLRHFEGELQAVVALSFFIPLLIGTGGNAGSQTTATIIRALAVGDLGIKDAVKALWHELRTGMILGVAMAVVAYVRALLWDSSQGLALTVAIAILSIVVWANSLGAILPLIAARLKIDPTVVSGPVMSTLVDATGLFIYFTIAGWMLGL
jgi:magnesium transporter